MEPRDLVNAIVTENPAQFKLGFDEIMQGLVNQRIEDYKGVVASSFAKPDTDEVEYADEPVEETEESELEEQLRPNPHPKPKQGKSFRLDKDKFRAMIAAKSTKSSK